MQYRRVIAFFLVLLLAGVGAVPALAAEVEPYAGISYNTVDMEDLNAVIAEANIFFGLNMEKIVSAFGFAGGVNIGTGGPLSVDLEVEHLSYGTSDASGGESAEFSGSSTGAGALVRYELETIGLSVYAGPIYHFGKMTSQNEGSDGTIETEYTGSGRGFKAGVGFQHAVSNQVSIQARGGYRSLEYDVEDESDGGSAELTGLEALAGLTVHF